MMAISTDYQWLRGFIADRCANQLTPEQDYLFDTRLGPVLREMRIPTLSALVRSLQERPVGPLADAVIDAMTTNETFFFRDATFFGALEKELLPQVIEARWRDKQLNIWSAACSTGQELYSVAMLLREHFPELVNWQVRFVATDVSPSALARARAGRYSRMEIGRGLPPTLLERYFRPVGTEWEVDARLRSKVEFHQLNLDHSWPALPQMDLVLLRNVLIYFDDATRCRVLDRTARQLTWSGRLVLGAQERPPAAARLEKVPGGIYHSFRAPSLRR